MNSRAKGKRGELQARDWWREQGYDCTRGQQHRGGPGSPDIIGVPGVHLEVKLRARIAGAYDWVDQANDEAGKGELPIVMARANSKPWLFILDCDTFLALYEAWRSTHHPETLADDSGLISCSSPTSVVGAEPSRIRGKS